MDLNTTTFVALPQPRFAPELLFPALLAANISVALVADYYSETAFYLQSNNKIAVISAMSLDAYSRCAGQFLRIQLACYYCSAAQLGFVGRIVEQQNAAREQLAQLVFKMLNENVPVETIQRELLLENADNLNQTFYRDLCVRLKHFDAQLDCGSLGDVKTEIEQQGLRLEDIIAQAVRVGLTPIAEHRGLQRCAALYRYLGLRYYSCYDDRTCVRGSGGGPAQQAGGQDAQEHVFKDFSGAPLNWELLEALRLDFGVLPAHWDAEDDWHAREKRLRHPSSLLAVLLCAAVAAATIAAAF